MKRRLLMFVTALLTALPGCADRPSSGDRVLVAKFLYETHIAEPERFQVVVFKFPDKPVTDNVPTNYIKRLLGLPGEILAIFFGQLYRMPAPEPGQGPYFHDSANSEINPDNLWKAPYLHRNESQSLFDAGKFEIIRKPPEVMMALRRIVYDNDFPAKDLQGADWERWQPAPESGWSADKEHGFTHQGAAKDTVDWLRYRHVLRPMEDNRELPPKSGRKPELITDFMDYNSIIVQAAGKDEVEFSRIPSPNWAGDLMLECKVQVAKAEGEFWLELSKGSNRFQARWDLASGFCTLYKVSLDGTKVELGNKATAIKAAGNYLVRFANFDARLTVWVDAELPFGDGRDYPPPEIRAPNESKPGEHYLSEDALRARRGPTQNDLEPASIGSKGGAARIQNIKLWRDTYYTTDAHFPGSDVSLSAGDWSNPTKWSDIYKDMPVKTMYVQPGHYLCLGDNSQASSDSRDWGLVPHRLMLGRALLVYFPLQRAGPIR